MDKNPIIMAHTSTLAIALVLALTAHTRSSAQVLAPQAAAPLEQHLLEVNAQWHTQGPLATEDMPTVRFANEAERIATHLHMVRERLMARMPEGLSAEQQAERTQLLDRLAHYADEGRFPQNHVLPYRNPVFIDPYGTACAVGWLMIESGHRTLAEEISDAMNLAYVMDMPGTPQWPAIATWASEHGFGADELAWIQPGYPPSIPWAALGGGTNGTVKVLHELANGNILVVGGFSEAGGNAAAQVALWNGNALVPLGAGLQGEVTCAVEFNGDLYVGGSQLNGNADLAKWNGANWSYSVVFDGKLPRTNALHVHEGVLHAAGEMAGFAAIDHYVSRLSGSTWETLGQPFNEAIHALESFNGTLVAGGAFTQQQWVTDPLIPHVARFDGTDWLPLGNGLDATVRDLIIMNGKLYAAGNLLANILPTFGLARIENTTGSWENLLPNHPNYMGGGIGPSYISSLATFGDVLYFGGRFELYSLMTMGNHIATFNGQPDGVEPLAYLDQEVHAVAFSGNRLVMGGAFTGVLSHLASTDITTGFEPMPAVRGALEIHPRPAHELVSLTLPDIDISAAEVRVLDLQGKVCAVPVRRQGKQVVLDLAALSSGTYIVQVAIGDRYYTDRLLKE
jgi:hypothetical protein